MTNHRIWYLPESTIDLSNSALREHMRRHHWRRYFLALRINDRKSAEYHRVLAESLERKRENA